MMAKLRERYGKKAEPQLDGGADVEAHFKSQVWVPDEEHVWRVAKVEAVNEDGKTLTVRLPGLDGAKFDVDKGSAPQFDPSHALDLDDASKMNAMHEAPLLDLLLRRFRQDKIYTNMADVLVSVNPYKRIPLLYEIPLYQMQDNSDEEYEESDGEAEAQEADAPKDRRPAALKSKLSKPHVHSVADRAFRYMTEPGREYAHGKLRSQNQSIIITGESGAGKTEASKYVMRYLITASQILGGAAEADGEHEAGSGEGPKDALAKRIEDVLLQANTVLEAFGNAKTVRNDNSSRFGKYIKLQYDGAFRLVGARTEHFLLEKSRLVRVDADERSYHIFYQLCAGVGGSSGAAAQLRAELSLGSAAAFYGIAQGNCLAASEDIDDSTEYKRTDAALSTLGFSQMTKVSMYRLLAALLHLSNVQFEELADGASDVSGGGEITVSSADPAAEVAAAAENGHAKCRMGFREPENGTVGAQMSVAKLAALLGLQGEALQHRVVRRGMLTARQSFHEIPLNADQSRDNLLGLSKHLYGQLFAFVVWKINQCHMERVAGGGGGEGGEGSASPRGVAEASGESRARAFIGILDIFGFEIMQTNSFEQLCINYANEVLQRQFNHHIFVLEQAEYAAEGLDVASIPFRDNQPIIDLVAKKPAGLMIILEDQVLTGRKAYAANNVDDRHLLALYHQAHHRQNPHPNYQKPRLECDQFILKHFAGSVTYDVAGFLEKNNDSLQDDLRQLLLDSSDPFMSALVDGSAEAGFGFHASDETLPPTPQQQQQMTRRASAEGMPAPAPGLRRAGDARMAAANTVSSTFRRQLDQLVEQLGATEPHYIKCIKPNAAKAAGGWSSPLVIQQLRYSGVLEVVRIRREAFPTRITFQEFYRRFAQLLPWRTQGLASPATATPEQAKEACQAICGLALGPGEFQLGHSKAFLRDDGLDRLRASLQRHFVVSATAIQAAWRGRCARKALSRERDAAIELQRRVRGALCRRRYLKMRRAAVQAQAEWRRLQQLRAYRKARTVAVVLQAYCRMRNALKLGVRARAKAAREATAAVKIQMAARGWLARRRLAAAIAAAVAVQRLARGRAARTKFCTMRTQDRLRREREAKKATRMQAWARTILARRQRLMAIRAATRIQAAWRGKRARSRYAAARAAAMKLQAAERMRQGRAYYKYQLFSVTKIQAMVRMFLARRRYLRALAAARRIQRATRAFLRNQELMRATIGLFAAAETGDANEVTRHITEWPELLFVRTRWDAESSFKTLLHAACSSGRMDMVALLEPFPEDVFAVERLGNTCIHYAAGAANYDLMKYLAKRANMDVEYALAEDEERAKVTRQLSRRKVSTNVNVFKLARLERARLLRQIGAVRAKAHKGGDGGDEKHIMSGYLKKRRETDRWLRRWTVLTEKSLMYYHKQGDAAPSKVIRLDTAMLKKSDRLDFAFELHTPDLLDARNKEGRLYFQASSEEELQQWMVPLRMVVALYQFRHDKRREPMEFLDLAGRRNLVCLQNRAGETPLHAVARVAEAAEALHLAATATTGGPGGGGPAVPSSSAAVQRVAAWLVENGAEPNALDAAGQTPLHVAVASGNVDTAASLAKKGGDLNLARQADGRTPVQLASSEEAVAKLMQRFYHPSERHALLPPPKKLFGFTYASFLLEKSIVQSTATLTAPFVTVSVYNAKGQLTEAPQDVCFPAITRPNYLWWAHTWHMQTPLETLGKNSFIVFELRDQGERKAETLAWGVYHLDLDEMNTRTETLNMYEPPFDPKLKKMSMVDYILQGEAFLTKGAEAHA